MGQDCPTSNAHEYICEPTADVNTVAMAEQLFAHFFDPHFRPLHLAHHKVVNFRHWLVEQTDGAVNGFVIHLDEQTASKLIVAKFDQVFFGFANLDFELHNVRPNNNVLIADFMPEWKILSLAICSSRGNA
jgi:hypothetical protein